MDIFALITLFYSDIFLHLNLDISLKSILDLNEKLLKYNINKN